MLFSHSVVSDSRWPQASLSFTISWSLLKLVSTESVFLSNHLIEASLLNIFLRAYGFLIPPTKRSQKGPQCESHLRRIILSFCSQTPDTEPLGRWADGAGPCWPSPLCCFLKTVWGGGAAWGPQATLSLVWSPFGFEWSVFLHLPQGLGFEKHSRTFELGFFVCVFRAR